jgi:molecular chaperone DnaJ
MSSKNLYNVLGVGKDAGESELKKAYHKLALQHHPDKGGDPEKFKEIQEAHAILSEPEKRRMYDMTGQVPGAVDGEQGGGAGGMPFPFPFGPGGGFGGGFPGGFGDGPGFNVDINDLFGMFGRGGPGRQSAASRGHGSGPGHSPHGPHTGRNPGKAAAKVSAVPLTFRDYYYGRNLEISFERQRFCGGCAGRGSKEFHPCGPCGGSGHVSKVMQMGPVMMHQQGPCPMCRGLGKTKGNPCGDCAGSCFKKDVKKIMLEVKPGTPVGTKITYSGESSNEEAFDEAGDVILELVEADEESVWVRKGHDMHATISITLRQSLVSTIEVIGGHPGFDGGLAVRVPAGVQNGSVVRVSGAGMPILGLSEAKDGGKGDAFLLVNVRTTAEERELLAAHAVLLRSVFRQAEREREAEGEEVEGVLDGLEEGVQVEKN